jgi:type I restriction enzyme S subunit
MIYEGNHKLGDFFSSRRERGTPGLPMLSVTMNNGVVTRESLNRKMETNLSDEEHLLVRKGDIVYNMMRMWQGASGLADRDGLLSPAYVVLASKKGIDPLYASYLFKSPRLIYLLWAYSYGLTSDRLRLYFNDFKRIPVNIPLLSEQRKIGKILSTWDKAIGVVEALIENSKEQKAALIPSLLSGRVRFSEFKGSWKKNKFSESLNIKIGGTPSRSNPNYWDDMKVTQNRWLSISDLKENVIMDSTEYITDLGVKKSNVTLFSAGVIVMSFKLTIGRKAKLGVDCYTNEAICGLLIKDNSELDNDFLFHAIDLVDFEQDTDQAVKGKTLNKAKLNELTIRFPELKEQQRIVKVLNAADREIEILQQKLTCLKQEKKALMQQLLTGKRRVKVDES